MTVQRAEFADREQASVPVSSGLFGWDLFEGQRKGFAGMGIAPQAGEAPSLIPMLIYNYQRSIKCHSPDYLSSILLKVVYMYCVLE